MVLLHSLIINQRNGAQRTGISQSLGSREMNKPEDVSQKVEIHCEWSRGQPRLYGTSPCEVSVYHLSLHWASHAVVCHLIQPTNRLHFFFFSPFPFYVFYSYAIATEGDSHVIFPFFLSGLKEAESDAKALMQLKAVLRGGTSQESSFCMERQSGGGCC